MPNRGAKDAHRQCERRLTVARLGMFRNLKDGLSQTRRSNWPLQSGKNGCFAR